MSFISHDFLKSSYTKSSDENEVKKEEQKKFDHPSKTKCNGSVEWASVDDLDFRPETAFCSNGSTFMKVNNDKSHWTDFVHENGSKVYKKGGPLTSSALKNPNIGLEDS